jgi:hypothetical protein
MPKRFKFFIDDELHFACNLKPHQCSAVKPNGQQCSKRTVIGTDMCWTHLLYRKHLRIKNSNVAGGGKGLFALDPKRVNNEIIFRTGQTIIFYGGDVISKPELDRRYDEYTAPYGVQIQGVDGNGRQLYRDTACDRGIGSLANHGNANRENARFSFGNNGVLNLKATKNIRNAKEIFVNYNRGATRGDPTRYILNEAGIESKTVNVSDANMQNYYRR